MTRPTHQAAVALPTRNGEHGLSKGNGSPNQNERTDIREKHPPFNHDNYLQQSPHEADGGKKVGLDPASVGLDKLRALGHPESPIRAIRAKCLDCCGGSTAEVRKCVAIGCPNWPLRMGRNPFHGRAGRRVRSR
jgi:hypothetical protein